MMKMKILHLSLLLMILFTPLVSMAAENSPKVVVIAFQLDDKTELPNAAEELKRVELLSITFINHLIRKEVTTVSPSEKVQIDINKHSPSYLFENVETALDLNRDAQADYLIIGVAFKPTYLFVYPRLLMVDTRTRKVVMSKYAQLESSWSDQNTTVRTAEKLADLVKQRLDALRAGNQ